MLCKASRSLEDTACKNSALALRNDLMMARPWYMAGTFNRKLCMRWLLAILLP